MHRDDSKLSSLEDFSESLGDLGNGLSVLSVLGDSGLLHVSVLSDDVSDTFVHLFGVSGDIAASLGGSGVVGGVDLLVGGSVLSDDGEFLSGEVTLAFLHQSAVLDTGALLHQSLELVLSDLELGDLFLLLGLGGLLLSGDVTGKLGVELLVDSGDILGEYLGESLESLGSSLLGLALKDLNKPSVELLNSLGVLPSEVGHEGGVLLLVVLDGGELDTVEFLGVLLDAGIVALGRLDGGLLLVLGIGFLGLTVMFAVDSLDILLVVLVQLGNSLLVADLVGGDGSFDLGDGFGVVFGGDGVPFFLEVRKSALLLGLSLEGESIEIALGDDVLGFGGDGLLVSADPFRVGFLGFVFGGGGFLDGHDTPFLADLAFVESGILGALLFVA